MSRMRGLLRTTVLATALAVSAPARADDLPPVIRLGMLTDMGGAYKANSGPGDLVAARMAVEDFGGTVAGRPVEVIGADEQNKPDVASSIAREWFDRGGVSAIFDGGNSVTAGATHEISLACRALTYDDAPSRLRGNGACRSRSWDGILLRSRTRAAPARSSTA